MKKLSNKLAIIGNGDWDEGIISWKDETIEKWVLGGYMFKHKDIRLNCPNTRIFEIHTMHTRSVQYLDFLRETEYEIIAQSDFKFLKKPIIYPLDAVMGKYRTNYFLCSFSYMVALAMYLEYEKIYLYNANMVYTDDYIQKYNFEYWLGRAEQAGIEIVMTENCDLLKCGALYGYEADNTLGVYMEKYMNSLKQSVFDSTHSIIRDVTNILTKLRILEIERPKFMQEILDRHKINADIQKDWNNDDN